MFDALRSAQAQGMEVLIVDTAGRLHSQSHLMEELKKVRRVLARVDPAAPDEVLLVLDANQGQNALAQAREFHAAVGVTGLVLTKLDGTARGGIVVAIARELKLPIRFIGIGEHAGRFRRVRRGGLRRCAARNRYRCKVGGMIRFDRASKRYPNGREALTAASLDIRDGEMVFLTGRSGAGKSTILKLISLLERPTRGLVMVNGHNTAALSSRKIPASGASLEWYSRTIGCCPSAASSTMSRCHCTPAETGVTLKEIDRRVRAALDQVGLLSVPAHCHWSYRWASSSELASHAPW